MGFHCTFLLEIDVEAHPHLEFVSVELFLQPQRPGNALPRGKQSVIAKHSPAVAFTALLNSLNCVLLYANHLPNKARLEQAVLNRL